MNRGKLKSLALALLDEKGEYYDSEIDDLADLSNRAVWRWLGEHASHHTATRIRMTVPADTYAYDITADTASSAVPIYVHTLSMLPENAVVSPTNRPTPVNYVEPDDDGGHVFPVNDPNTARSLAWTWDEEQYVKFIPPAGVQRHFLVRLTMDVADMTVDADNLLGGKAIRYHEKVVSTLYNLLASKDRSSALLDITRFVDSILSRPTARTVKVRKGGYTSPY